MSNIQANAFFLLISRLFYHSHIEHPRVGNKGPLVCFQDCFPVAATRSCDTEDEENPRPSPANHLARNRPSSAPGNIFEPAVDASSGHVHRSRACHCGLCQAIGPASVQQTHVSCFRQRARPQEIDYAKQYHCRIKQQGNTWVLPSSGSHILVYSAPSTKHSFENLGCKQPVGFCKVLRPQAAKSTILLRPFFWCPTKA